MKKVIAMNGREEQMDDLIKRQDAITAYCEHECGIKGMTRENCGATDCGTIFDDIPTADVVEVGKWCDMHGYILEMQSDENGHNEFFRIIKLPVISSDDELKMKKEFMAKAILYGADMRGGS